MADILKKLAAVVFITMLIWAWAYLALEEEIEQTGRLDISPAIRQDLFVNFKDRPAPVSLKLTMKGPPVQIAELKKRLRASDVDPDKERLDFFYNPESQSQSAPGSHELSVVAFLNESDKLKDIAVTVVSCEPDVITVEVEELILKPLTIQCLDEHGARLADATIEPASVEMFVHDDWSGDLLTATVSLSAPAAEKARKGPVSEKPYIELENGKRIYSKSPVSIKLPTESLLQDRVSNPLKLGYIFSRNLHGRYTVQLINENDLRTLQYKASDHAFKAYENQPYHILIEIHDGDENAPNNIQRQIIYNFPEEFVQKGEIKLAGPPHPAIFKLVPVPKKPE